MKINQRIIIIICIAIFLVGLVILYMNYSTAASQQKSSEKSLASVAATLQTVNTNKSKQEELLAQARSNVAILQSQLAQVQQQLSEKQQVIPQIIENIDYNELFFTMAHQNGLTVLSINTTGPTRNQVDKVTLVITSFSVSVRGQTQDILKYVTQISQDSNFISGTIDSIMVTITTEEGPEGEEILTTQCDINLTLYGYEE